MNRFAKKAVCLAALLAASAATAAAADHEVRMLNVGPDEKSTMVFDPPLLRIEKGDTVTFVPADRGHNSASMAGMLPRGATEWAGAISEPVTVKFDADGTYGYICEPHYGLGMVGLVLVGDYHVNFDTAASVRQRGRAAQRFRELFRQAAAGATAQAATTAPATGGAEAPASGGTEAPASDTGTAPAHDMGTTEAPKP